jgi:pimeloyl-ACP methyl ester carboxylesterase
MGEKDGDHSDPAAEAKRIASELGGPATVELLAESGHYPHVDAPDVTNQAVTRFLTEG